MAAPTHTYCDYAAGNDYKGSTFTDGAFTVADMTLTKVGAFAASKVNHWLYLDDNGSGEVTPGYYKIASVTSADAVVLATSPKSGANDPTDVVCTQHDGTTSLPWRSVQGALDLITRDATNGDQINVKAGTAQVLSAALALTTYGTPAEGVPLVIRGYTSAANDGGIGEINGATFAILANNALTDLGFVDLKIHSNVNSNMFYTYGARCFVHHCEVYADGGTNTTILNIHTVLNSIIHHATGSGYGLSNVTFVYGNYIYSCVNGIGSPGVAVNNIIVDATTIGILAADASKVIANAIYSSSAATGKGISAPSGVTNSVILNNIIEGYSGVGGIGISAVGDLAVVGYNATYNCTTPTSYVRKWGDLTANDVVCASSPFTNAGAGDFSLNTAVAGAIDGAFPGAWYGPAGTTDHADIGAVQNPAGSGGVSVRHPRGLWIMR